MILRRLLLALALITASLAMPLISSAAEMSPDFHTMERDLETKIQSKIDALFGVQPRIIVTLTMREKLKKAAAPERKENWVDVGYLSLPMNNEPSKDSAAAKSFSIESVNVDLQVPETIAPQTVEQLKSLVKKNIPEIQPNITVSKFTPPKEEPQKEAQKEKEKKDKDLMSLLPSLASFLGLVLAALLLSAGIWLMARAVRMATQTIVDGMRESKGTVKSETISVQPLKTSVTPEPQTPSKQNPPLPSALKNYNKNITLLRSVLSENPILWVRCIQDQEDWIGTRWLLPLLNFDEQELLKRSLGPKRLKNLEEAKSTQPESIDQTAWLQGFAEKVVLSRIRGESSTQVALGPEKSIQFLTMEPQVLLEAVRSMGNNSSAWRLLVEFLPRNSLEVLFNQMEPDQWKWVISSYNLNSQEIPKTAEEILGKVKEIEKSRDEVNRKETYFSTYLIEPLIHHLISKVPGDDDLLLEELSQTAPELVSLVHTRLWTSKILDRIPDEVIKPFLMGLPDPQKVALLIAYPEQQASRIEALLPEGTAKTIILDQVRKIRARNDLTERKSTFLIARQFLDSLRTQAATGKFELLPEASAANLPPGRPETGAAA